MLSIAVHAPGALLTGQRNHVLLAATSRDTYQQSGGQPQIASRDNIEHGTAVQAVTHFTGSYFVVGLPMMIKDENTMYDIGEVQITSIRMAHADQLTQSDLIGLGYASREEFRAKTGDQDRGWLMTVRPI
jgi:hypothetical protein